MRDQNREPHLTETPILAPDTRLSIWTIRAEWIGWFYLLFTLHAAPLIFALWWSEHYGGAHANIASTIIAVVGGSASLIFVAAIASALELEFAMVLRHLLEKRDARKERENAEAEFTRGKTEGDELGFERGIEQGIEQGIERGRQLEREEQARRRDEYNGNGNQEE